MMKTLQKCQITLNFPHRLNCTASDISYICGKRSKGCYTDKAVKEMGELVGELHTECSLSARV